MVGELSIPGNVHRGCTNYLALFAEIHGLNCRNKFHGRAKSNFDESQAIAVQHNQVDFAAATTEVTCDGFQSSRNEVLQRSLLCAAAYSS